ncbi:MAG: DUF1573 domain-containing protein [Thermoanaerobaculia bacterium]
MRENRDGGVLREIDLLRKKYADHRSTLERLASDAPSEALAARYRELIGELDASMARIAELELHGTEPEQQAAEPSWHDRPIHAPSPAAHHAAARPSTGARTLLIVLAGIFMIAILGILAWNWIQDEEEPADQIAATGTAPPAAAPPPAEPAEADLIVRPQAHDFGTVSRGARAARQFEVVNQTDATLPIQVQRSDCRCLWFEYADTIPPRGTTTLTVTVDGTKAPPGRLTETVEIVSRTEPPVSVSFDVTASIQ